METDYIFSDRNGSSLPRRKFKIFPIVLFLIGGAIYYFLNQEIVPVTGRAQLVTMDRQSEMRLGVRSYSEVLSDADIVSSGPELDLIRRVGQRIAKVSDDPGFEWEFNLIRSEQANAFCLPGGKVAFYTGILPIVANEDGLAVVMAHEISHAIARHGAERMAQSTLAQLGQLAVGMSVSDMDPQTRRSISQAFGVGAQYGLLLPFSRKHESEADYIGLIYMARACFNPEEAPKLWERMKAASSATGSPPQFMSTHPSNETRIQQFNSWMDEAKHEYDTHCR